MGTSGFCRLYSQKRASWKGELSRDWNVDARAWLQCVGNLCTFNLVAGISF